MCGRVLPPFELQVVGDLEKHRGNPLPVVEVAVIAVYGVCPAADPVEGVGEAVEVGVGVLEA
jgi:hypothetical protein